MTGVVKSFSRTHGYGFIEADGKEWWFHIKDCKTNPIAGMRVKFQPWKTSKGFKAKGVEDAFG